LGATAEVDQITRKLAEHRLLFGVDRAFLAVDEVDPSSGDPIDLTPRQQRHVVDPVVIYALDGAIAEPRKPMLQAAFERARCLAE
jgi:hypothetical protein